MKPVVLLAILVLAVPTVAIAQKSPSTSTTPAEPLRVVPPGPAPAKAPSIAGVIAIGDPAPHFELDASDGSAVRLNSLRGSWVVLAFADRWQHLEPLRQVDQELRPIGAKVVGLCHEKAHTLLGVSGRDRAPVLLLADVTGEISAIYGQFDFQRSETEPGFFILDPRGVVQLAVIGPLPPPDSIVRLAQFAITGL
jgi:peroxiredoxin